MDEFGCERCWPADPAKAWEAVTQTRIDEHLIDEAHYIVGIRACEACGQRYLQVTTELVDWQDGEDPIYRTVIPIDATEYSRLKTDLPPDAGVIASVDPGRQSLRYAWPEGEDESICWGTGVSVGPHD